MTAKVSDAATGAVVVQVLTEIHPSDLIPTQCESLLNRGFLLLNSFQTPCVITPQRCNERTIIDVRSGHDNIRGRPIFHLQMAMGRSLADGVLMVFCTDISVSLKTAFGALLRHDMSYPGRRLEFLVGLSWQSLEAKASLEVHLVFETTLGMRFDVVGQYQDQRAS